MSSAPSPVGTYVSRELYNFFRIEMDNATSMTTISGGIPPADLGMAENSLAQAPEAVLANWFYGEDGHRGSIVVPLMEFGRLYERFGDGALLCEFAPEPDWEPA